ncbi:MAG: amidohydrolase family protein [Phycisphaerae bacterium]
MSKANFTYHQTTGPALRRSARCAGIGWLWTAVVVAAPVPIVQAGVEDGEPVYVVVKAARVITATGDMFEPGEVVIEDGKISLVGSSLEYPGSATVIEAPGRTVMPGLVLARSRFGLPRYTRRGVHGDQNVADEVFLGLQSFDEFVQAGYTTVCFYPAGQGIPGLACAYKTAGPADQRRLGPNAYLEVAAAFNSSAKGKALLRNALKKAKDEIEKVEKARKEWEEKQKKAKEESEKKKDSEKPEKEKKDKNGKAARHRGRGRAHHGNGDEPEKKEAANGKEPEKAEVFEPPPIDPKHQPLVDLIQEKEGARMMVRLARASDWLHLDDVLEPYDDLAHSLYLTRWGRTTDFHHVIKQLGQRKVQIVIKPFVYRLPYTATRYNLMRELARAGCELSTVPVRDSRRELLAARRRLAEVVRAGLEREQAIGSLTLHPARVIGLEERLGSLEKGKDADLVFLDADPLDPHSTVVGVMIEGKMVWEAQDSQ